MGPGESRPGTRARTVSGVGADDRLFEVLEPVGLEPARGFSHGLLAPEGGRLLFVAGQPGVDLGAGGSDGAPGFVEQFDHALHRVLTVVEQAGGRPEHVGRMTVYVTDLDAYLASRSELGDVWREHMGRHYPAMALLEVAGLVDEGAAVEIEATAVLPERPGED